MSWTIYHGDVLAIPERFVDLLLADPPYNSGGRTGNERALQSARDKYIRSDAAHDLADFVGDNRDQRGYTYWLTLVLA
ncbi:hypothetical protein OHA25_08340 [Nonomuraea sp. NBC_00507]|uniref:hypothetical protein n=1 Tax=Nonomuraea sp. NBC_00507 TaxID=2976002 RepID=UPI002E175A1E